MNNIYVAEDGTIHACSNEPDAAAYSVQPSFSAPSSYNTYSYEAGSERKTWFWVYSIALSILIGAGAAALSNLVELGSSSFFYFFEALLPYCVFGGSILGAILYGCKGAPCLSYNLGAFILSPLCAIAGVLGVGTIVCIVPFILIGIWYLFLIALVVAVIVGIFSGGD